MRASTSKPIPRVSHETVLTGFALAGMSGMRRMTCLRTGGKARIRTRTSSRTLTEQFYVHTYPPCTPSIHRNVLLL